MCHRLPQTEIRQTSAAILSAKRLIGWKNVSGQPWQNCEIPAAYIHRRCLVEGCDPQILSVQNVTGQRRSEVMKVKAYRTIAEPRRRASAISSAIKRSENTLHLSKAEAEIYRRSHPDTGLKP